MCHPLVCRYNQPLVPPPLLLYPQFIAATVWTRVNVDEEKLHKVCVHQACTRLFPDPHSGGVVQVELWGPHEKLLFPTIFEVGMCTHVLGKPTLS